MNTQQIRQCDRSLEVISWGIGKAVPTAFYRMKSEAGLPLVLCIDIRERGNINDWRELHSFLAPDERLRHSRYRTLFDAERFLVGRGLLRLLLASAFAVSAAQAPIFTSHHGKPFSPGGPQFNVSHSGNLVLIALHPKLPVGVDVEIEAAPIPDWKAIAGRIFAAEIVSSILEMPNDRQNQAFLQAWCHLEAQLKMAGCGFAAGHADSIDQCASRQWILDLPRGYVGSVVIRR